MKKKKKKVSNTLLKLAWVYFNVPFTHSELGKIFDGIKTSVIEMIWGSLLLSPHLFDCASDGFLSLCLLFLNQLLTCVKESPVILARFLFSAGDGYLF